MIGRPSSTSSATRLTQLARAFLASEYTWCAIYLGIAVTATSICVDRSCNNFLIFRAAFDHLLAGRDMYIAYPREHVDLFKYSPTFALLFAPFAKLPFGVALLGWNLLNVMLLYLAIRVVIPTERRLQAIQLGGIGLVATVDGTQSNGIVAALMILTFVALERNRLLPAALAVALGALVKLFPLAALALVLPRRDRWRFAAVGLVSGAILIALPLLVTDASTLAVQYRSWQAMASVDALDRGASVMRLIELATGYDGPNWPIQLAGSVVLVLPIVLRPSRWEDADFRRAFLASLLVYAVIFNHKAEQPSFVIAVAGMAIWYATSEPSAVRNLIVGATFAATVPILVTVSAAGALPWTVEQSLLVVAACCTVGWFTMQGELLDLFPERIEVPDAAMATVSDEPAVRGSRLSS